MPEPPPAGSMAGPAPSAAVGRRRCCAGTMSGEGDHEPPIGLGAEGKTKPTAAADALHLAAAAAGGAGHEPHALVAEHRRRIGRHYADSRDALPHQRRRLGAGLGGGIDHQPLGRCQAQGGLIGGPHREVGERPCRPQMPGGPRQLEQQGLIDAQRIGRIRPLITGDAVAEEDARRQRHHLANEGRCRGAALAAAEPIPVQPGVEAGLGIAALITSQGAGGGAGEAACAGDSNRAGFAVVGWEGQGGTVGLGSSHRRGDAGPALQPRRQARASHQRMAQRSGAQRPAQLAGETLAKARSMEGPAAPTSQRSRELLSGWHPPPPPSPCRLLPPSSASQSSGGCSGRSGRCRRGWCRSPDQPPQRGRARSDGWG